MELIFVAMEVEMARNKEKILVVDELEQMAELIRMMLTVSGFEQIEVLSAANIDEASEVVEAEKADLEVVLVNAVLGEENGFDLVEKIERVNDLGRLRCVVMTALDEEDIEARLGRTEVEGVLQMPFELEELLAVLSLDLSKSR